MAFVSIRANANEIEAQPFLGSTAPKNSASAPGCCGKVCNACVGFARWWFCPSWCQVIGGCCAVFGCLLLSLGIIASICAAKRSASVVSEQFVDDNLGGDGMVGWWTPSPKQNWDVIRELRGNLDRNGSPPEKYKEKWPLTANVTFAWGSAVDVMDSMYNATTVPGLIEDVPEKMRGVFWMKGNGIAEELSTLQYGMYFADERLLVTPMAPFSWAWPNSAPVDAPYSGKMYGAGLAMSAALSLVQTGLPGIAFKTKFMPCPSGAACEEGRDDLAYALLEVSIADIAANQLDLAHMVPILPSWAQHLTATFTFEEIESVQPGAHWKRGVYWGVGGCKCFEFGSYDLVKVIDAEGEPLQPHYDEFVEYIGDVKLFSWSGFLNDEKGNPTPPHRVNEEKTIWT